MADFKILNKARIQSSQIFEDAKTYISRAYKRTGEFFTAASPYAQILLVLSELGQLIMFYIEDALVEQVQKELIIFVLRNRLKVFMV